MHNVDCPPRPTCLIESMRHVGYSMETAIADIVDNSIAASAQQIRILHNCDQHGPTLGIIDNGHGMSESELIEAMRAGGNNGPLFERLATDMGRFGLGLKTASFSQCRRLTVISRKAGCALAAACWDLDELGDAWILKVYSSENEVAALPVSLELSDKPGTIIYWEKMDCIWGQATDMASAQKIFLARIEQVSAHLSLVFHRLLDGTSGQHLAISINHIPLRAFDPYFSNHKATQRLQEEVILVPNRREKVRVQPYIIPHYSKLSGPERDRFNEMGGPAGTQGFYVYRNRRLLAWGDWFRLRRAKTEASGLARVMIDIPNSLDDLWSLDIKKSSVSPPEFVRSELARIIERITSCSTRTYISRGQRLSAKRHTLWLRQESNKRSNYVLDREHPLLESFFFTLSKEGQLQMKGILDLIEKNLPIEAIYNDRLGENIAPHPIALSNEAAQSYSSLIQMMKNQGIEQAKILEIIKALNMSDTVGVQTKEL